MVDEQLPMQRKILKGQVAARNEETNVHVRSEINNKWQLFGLLYCGGGAVEGRRGGCFSADEVCS